MNASQHISLRIFLEEGSKFNGHPAYQALLEYLRTHNYAGATAMRAIEGFGRTRKMHTAEMLELSTDLPVVVEVVDTIGKIAALKSELEKTNMVQSALITEHEVIVYRFNQ